LAKAKSVPVAGISSELRKAWTQNPTVLFISWQCNLEHVASPLP
jgi:hypothetical protein